MEDEASNDVEAVEYIDSNDEDDQSGESLVIMNKKPSTAYLSAYKRKRYAELKNDPEMYEREKEKERLRYIKKKEKGQVIPIDEKSPRDQRQQRKQWREASKRYRENKKARPIMLLLRRLIRNKQNTVMTNAQIIDILHSEFDICIKSSHELEINIYIKIIKRYLKDWPQWEELERISTKLSNCKDYEAISKVLNHKYKNLKEYLGVMLEIAKPLAKKAVQDIDPSTTEPKETVVPEENNDNQQIVMELQCSREQLNYLITRYPDCVEKKCIFNLVPKPTRIRLGALTFADIIKGWPLKIAINLPHLVLHREFIFKLEHTLVNKARQRDRKCKVHILKNTVQEMTTKKTVNVPKRVVVQTLDDILTACVADKEMFVVLHSIFDVMKPEIDKIVAAFKVPSTYRTFGNRYKYVRYLYSDEGQRNEMYDLQLQELMTPIYMYNVHIARGDYGEITLPSLAEWFKLECGICNFKPVGVTLVEIKEKLVAHVKDHIGDEPDWQCTNCVQTFSLKFLTMNQWFHKCRL